MANLGRLDRDRGHHADHVIAVDNLHPKDKLHWEVAVAFLKLVHEVGVNQEDVRRYAPHDPHELGPKLLDFVDHEILAFEI